MSKFLDKTRVRVALLAAQSVIEMTNTELPIAAIDQQMEQHDGIASAGNADKVFLVWWKLAKNLEVET